MLSRTDFSFKQILFIHANNGERFTFLNDNIVVKKKDDSVVFQGSCHRIFAIYIVGNFVITSGLIQRAHKFGISIVLMTTGYRIYQVIGFKQDGNTILRKKQYNYNSLDIAKLLIKNKIYNQKSMIERINNKTVDERECVANLDKYISEIADIDNLKSLLGIEGSAAKIYFKNFFTNVAWKGRKPRIKPDMTNSLLDIGYTLIYSLIESLLSLYGFDIYQGFLHTNFYMRKSLVCDLVEPFRIIVDNIVKKGISLGQFKEDDFFQEYGRYDLEWKKSSAYIGIFMKEILNEKDYVFLYIQDFYRAFMREKDIEEYPFYAYK